MNFKDLTNTIFRLWAGAQTGGHKPQTVVLLGQPGIGKTAVGHAVAELMTDFMRAKNPMAPPACDVALDLSSMLPEDLMGLPDTKSLVIGGQRVTTYVPQSWLAPLCEEGAYGVLILDDLPAADRAVQVACRQLSLTHRVHEAKLSPGIIIIVTGNRKEDASAARDLPKHFINSTCLLHLDPNRRDWEEWYAKQGFDGAVPAFLYVKPEFFSQLPTGGDKKTGSFATPRTWAMVGQNLGYLKTQEAKTALVAGLVGEGVALEFGAFLMLRNELASPADVLDNPKAAVPDLSKLNRPDKVIALITGLAEEAVERQNKGKKEAHIQLLKALEHVTSRNREYIAVALSSYTAQGGSNQKLIRAAQKAIKGGDQGVKDLIQFLSNALRGS